MDIVEIFPIPLYITTVTIDSNHENIILEERNNTYPNKYGNSTSLNTKILDNLELKPLKEEILSHIKKYNDTIFGYDASLKITQSWVNFNPNGSSHHTHNHYNSIISGVLYINDNSSEIIFQRNFTNSIVPAVTTKTKYNAPSFRLSPTKGMLVMFPSELKHGVNKNEKDNERISLAFNTFYTGIIGDNESLTLLELT